MWRQRQHQLNFRRLARVREWVLEASYSDGFWHDETFFFGVI